MLVSMVPDLFPRVSISSIASLWVFFILSTSLFRSWMVLFNSIACLVVFSCNSLRDFCVSSLMSSTCLVMFSCNSIRDFCVSSLMSSTCLAVFFCISLSELFKSFLISSTIIMRYAFKSRSSFSGVLGCPGLGEVGLLGSNDDQRITGQAEVKLRAFLGDYDGSQMEECCFKILLNIWFNGTANHPHEANISQGALFILQNFSIYLTTLLKGEAEVHII
ncbi:uncharacterized protein LOC102631730 [Mus musculus]|uniref:RIKEN cDNA 4930512M02 gene n=1 Tax=Mus musculus TaxID=10090 RepID=Q5SQK8_MOUSE|nr:uncharacterized protein LOC102631730 [Mus musculus]|eukprot:NP_001292072.1 uncharacterized protein LOC102631730 [Mus musculus]